MQRGRPGPIYLFGGIILEQITLNVPLHIENIRCASKVPLLGEFHVRQLQFEGPETTPRQTKAQEAGMDQATASKIVCGCSLFLLYNSFFFFFFDSY